MQTTLFGMVMEVKPEQFRNALLAIPRVPSFNII